MPWPEERGQIKQVIASNNRALVLTQDNKLWVCGNNYSGQLGLGDEVKQATLFTEVAWPAKQGKIQQIIVGQYHTVVLTDEHRLWGCGENCYGQLGLGDEVEQATFFTEVPWPAERGSIQQVIAGGYHTIVLTKDNHLWVCGWNTAGQLGLGNEVEKATLFTEVAWPTKQGKIQQIIAGQHHTVVLTDDHRLWVCGYNNYRQLGLGDKVEQATHFTEVAWPTKQGKIQQIIAGQHHTVVLTDDHRLWVCGDNRVGQLGLGNNEPQSIFTPVKALPKALQQVFTFNNYLNKLIKMESLLTKRLDIHNSQCQTNGPEGQALLNTMK